MKRLFFIPLLFFQMLVSASDSTQATPLVSQTIVYKTKQASEVYLVWTMDNWQVPAQKFLPTGSYVNNGMAYSKMNGNRDSFSIHLELPKNIYIDLMIWASKDMNGKPIEGWDNNWGSSYNLYVDGKNKIQTLTDEKLFIAEIKAHPFSILENGWLIVLTGFIILLVGLVIRFLKRKKSDSKVSYNHTFTPALIFATTALMLVARLQINDYLSNHQYLVLGLGFYDILFMAVYSFLCLIILSGLSRFKLLNKILQGLFILSLLFILIFSLVNIEVIRQLGKPITYNWLYYSDFLQANDAKNALKTGFNPLLVNNILMIVAGVLLAAWGIGILLKSSITKSKRSVKALFIFSIFIVAFSFIQHKSISIERNKVDNPVSTLFISWINSGKQSQLFSKKVSKETEERIVQMHTGHQIQTIPYADSIQNIIVFVLESTPANLVSLYDTTYRVTPNLEKWEQHARIYENMYAHLPTTAKTMFSLVTGVYPMISYRSIINEYPTIQIPSSPSMIRDNGMKTSLFFSSDLTYSHMGQFLKNHGIDTAADFKNIICNLEKFSSNYAQLDGLDDRCIVNRYFDWKNNDAGKKSFSILWTNQTHYPYFFKGDEKKFSENKEMNKYLNALEEVDNAFGELMDGLEKRNELDKTLVLVIGDHGEAFGTHGQYTHASNIYEENLRVPCMLVNPKMFNGERDSRIAGMIDIAPTLTHLLNISQPGNWQGASLLGNFKRDHTFFIGPYSDFLFGSRFENWKFIYNATTNQFKLFDLLNDPGEMKNVADKNEKIVSDEFELIAGWVQYHQNYLKGVLKE